MHETLNLDRKIPPIDINEFKTKSSLELIPEEVRPLANDILGIANTVYKDWVVLNWHGSIPRGDFISGESDADFSIITKNKPTIEQKEMRSRMLGEINQKWREKGVTKLDVIALGVDEIHDEKRRNGLFFCLTDGVNLPGSKELNLDFVLPTDRIDLVSMLNKYYKLWVDTVRIENTHEPRDIQQLRKRTIRAIYADAYIKGAPYERNWKQYSEKIKNFAPEWVDYYNILLRGDFRRDELMGIADKIVSRLKTYIDFETEW